jgi:hypothetical protein
MAATAEDHEHRVTPRELFFDLVFVIAFTQVRDAARRRPDVEPEGDLANNVPAERGVAAEQILEGMQPLLALTRRDRPSHARSAGRGARMCGRDVAELGHCSIHHERVRNPQRASCGDVGEDRSTTLPKPRRGRARRHPRAERPRDRHANPERDRAVAAEGGLSIGLRWRSARRSLSSSSTSRPPSARRVPTQAWA